MFKNVYQICLLIVNILAMVYIASIVIPYPYYLFFVFIAILLFVASIMRIHHDAKVNRFHERLYEARMELEAMLKRHGIDND